MNHQPCFPPHVLTGSIQNNGAQNINPYQNLVNKKEEHKYNTDLRGHSILTTSPQSDLPQDSPMNHQPCFPPHVLSGSIQNNGAQNINPYQNPNKQKEELKPNVYSNAQSILTTSPQSDLPQDPPMTLNLASHPSPYTLTRPTLRCRKCKIFNPPQNSNKQKEELQPNVHSKPQFILTTSTQSDLPQDPSVPSNLASLLSPYTSHQLYHGKCKNFKN